MVPNGWENKSLESLCDVDAPITYGVLKPGDYVPNGAPLLQIKDLLGDLSNLDTLHRISPELDYKYRRSRIATNDILISLVGTVGRVGLVPGELDGANIHRNLGRIRTKNYEFLIHYLNSDLAKNRIGLSSSGSSQSALNLSVLRALKVPIPPLPEQRKIAKILSTWDKAISTTERLIDNSKQQKKALMQQLLTGKKRLLDESGTPFQGEWEEITLEKLAKYRRGSFPQPYGNPEWVDEVNGYPFIQVYDIDKNMKLKPDTKIKISDAAIDKSVFIPKETVIVSLQGSIGRVAITQYDAYVDRTVLLFQEFIVPMDKVFFAFIIQELFEIEKTKAPGGTIKTITKEVLSNFKVYIPSYNEQQKIASVLINADQEIELLEQQLADLKQEKKALMQQLLTGKRRVKVDDEAAA